jgi:hypothetical protein
LEQETKELYDDDRITFGYTFTDFGDFSLIPMAEWELMGGGGQDGALLAINRAGKVIWKLLDAADWKCAEQYFSGQLVCVHQRDPKGTLEFISPVTGETVKSVALDFWPTLVSVTGDIVVVSGFDILLLSDDYRSTPHVSGYDDTGSLLWDQTTDLQCSPWESADYSVALSIGTALAITFNSCVTVILNPANGEISDQALSSVLVDHAGTFVSGSGNCNIGDDDYYWQSCPAGLAEKDELVLPDGQSVRLVYVTDLGDYFELVGTPWYITQEDDSSCVANVRRVDSGASVWKAPGDTFAVEMAGPNTLISLTRDRLSAHDLVADKELWSMKLQHSDTNLDSCYGYRLFILDDQTVLITDSEGMTGFSLADGRKLWDKMRPYPNVKYDPDKDKTHVTWSQLDGPFHRSLIAELNNNQLALVVPAQP